MSFWNTQNGRAWICGGALASGYSDRVECIPFSTITAFDTGSDMPTTMRRTAACSDGISIYVSEGYTISAYQNDVDRIDISTVTVHDTIASYEDILGTRGPVCTDLKVWFIGGANGTAFYDDVDWMQKSTETFTNIETGLTNSRCRPATIGTPLKIYAAGGRTTGQVLVSDVDCWTHSVETYVDIGDIPDDKDYCNFDQSDTMMYCADNTDSYGMNLATETWATLTSLSTDLTENYGNGSFNGSVGLKMGGSISSTVTDIIMRHAFATDTWSDTTSDLTEAKKWTAYCIG